MEAVQTNGEIHVSSTVDNNESVAVSSKIGEVTNHSAIDPETGSGVKEPKSESTPCEIENKSKPCENESKQSENENTPCDPTSTSCDSGEPNITNSMTIKEEPDESAVVTCSTSSGANGGDPETIHIKDESPEEKNIIDLTKKIFSSLPIKCESLKSENSASVEDKPGAESIDINETTDICMYVSGEGKLYHADKVTNEKSETDNQCPKVVINQNGVEYNIIPVQDEQLVNLVFKYLKLKDEGTKGIFNISIQGILDTMVQEESEQAPDTASTSEGDGIVVKEEPEETDNQRDEIKEEADNDSSRRRQPRRTAKLVPPVVETTSQPEFEQVKRKSTAANNTTKKKIKQETEEKEMFIKDTGKKQELKKLYTKSGMIPMDSAPRETESQAYLSSLFEKSARQKRKKGLIVDNKTDIPILEMKMNMQVTADTLANTPQLAPSSKRQMELLDKDNVMISPGKKIYSEKLLKLFNSRLFSTTTEDSDDDLEDVGLQPDIVPDYTMGRKKRNLAADSNKDVDWNTKEDDPKWKTYYL